MSIVDRNHDAAVHACRDLPHPDGRAEIDLCAISFRELNVQTSKIVFDLRRRQISKTLHEPPVADLHEDFLEARTDFFNPMQWKGIRQFIAEHEACDAAGREAVDVFQPTHWTRMPEPGSQLLLLKCAHGRAAFDEHITQPLSQGFGHLLTMR